MEELIQKALAAAQADYIEVRIHRARTTAVAFVGQELEDVGERSGVGGCVRALLRGGWGFVSFNDIEHLPRYVGLACEAARLVGGGTETIANAPPARAEVRATPAENPDAICLMEKHDLCARYNRLILGASPKIQTSVVRYADSRGSVIFANSEGTFITQEVIFCGISLLAVAKDGTNVQMAHHSVGDLRGFGIVRNLEGECETVARRAVDLLAAEPVRGGRYTVILDPKLTGVFAHEAFGHLSEADFCYENDRLRALMTFGKRFGSELVSVIDDPTLPLLAGSYAYDDEGTAARPTVLLKEGILCGRLHSRVTAAKMDEAPTGNARALGHTYAPIVRMSNTYVAAGPHSFEAMLAETPHGIYAVGFVGGQTNMEMFTFTAEEGYLIEGGRLGRRVRDVTLTGNLFETLTAIDRVAGDVQHVGGLGGCGKGGQGPLRVSSGGPHVRIRNVLVGGR